jgi:predicted transcriptional regulator of viral defense system
MSLPKPIKRHLANSLFLTTSEARQLKINPMMLSRLCQGGELFRIGHGVYTDDLTWLTDGLKKYIVPCSIYPKAVVCGLSALSYYNLTDEEEDKVWLTVPRPIQIVSPQYTCIRSSGVNYKLGINTHKFGKRTVRIYNVEKTVIDSFKYLWEEVAYKALKGYLKREDRNVKKLCEYGRQLKKPIDEVVSAILSDE